MAVGCRSARVPGVGASALRLSHFFAIGAVRQLRGIFLSMFCLVYGSVEPRKPACELESLEAS